MKKMIRIAIDGPSGAGKSTIAKAVARRLNLDYIDTGAMYRAIGYKIIENNIDLNDEDSLAKKQTQTENNFKDGNIYLDGEKVNHKIRTSEVSKMASRCSALKLVREKLVTLQREIGQKKDVIMDGRDIGTNVLTDAEYKFFMTATAEERARRRHLELLEKGQEISFITVLNDIKERDLNDTTRELNPLRMAKDNPYSFLHISRSEIDLPTEINQYDQRVYEKARANMEAFLAEGVLIREDKPVFFVYKQTMNGFSQVGITACVSLDEYIDNTIKKHEYTRIEKEIDRINHFDICNANTEPVFLTYRDNEEINKIVTDTINTKDPIYDIKTKDGIGHTLYKIEDDLIIDRIQELFTMVESLYIADGHHRSASACKVGLKRRDETPNYKGDEEFNYFMAVIFPGSQLKIYDYNRVVSDLNGNSEAELIEKIKNAGFEVERTGKTPEYPKNKHSFTMALGDYWYRLTASRDIIPDDITGSLDVSI